MTIGVPMSGQSGGIQPGVPIVQSTIGYTPAPNMPVTVENVARSIRVAQFGDSRTEQCYRVNGAFMRSIGYAYWAQMALGGRALFPYSLNFGVSGDTTAQMVARSLTVARSDADVVVVLGSTNDRTSGLTAAESIANLTTIVEDQRAAGKAVILIAETPRGDSTYTTKRLTASQIGEHLQVTRWIMRQASRRGVYPTDVWPVWCNSASTTADAVLGMTYDGLHPAQVGAKAIGDAVAAVLATILPAISGDVLASNADLYDATYNPRGNLLGNGMLDGSSGGVATGWTLLAAPTGVTITATKVTSGNNVWQQFAISGTPSTSSPSLEFRRDVASLAAVSGTETLEGSAMLEVDTGGSGYQAIVLGTRALYATQPTYTAEVGDVNVGIAPPSGAYGGYLLTPPHVLPGEVPTLLRLRLYVSMIQNTAISLTIRVRSMALRKVIS